jgi:hypothetical protein
MSSNSGQKYTVQSTGVWERIRRALAVDPNRSTGVPLNPQFRNPPPGANPPQTYDDPVTTPAGDIADNAYYNRDMRRNYPRISTVNQAHVSQLLLVGSKAIPRDDILPIKDTDTKQVVKVEGEGERKGLSSLFSEKKNMSVGIFDSHGQPPFPTGMNKLTPAGEKEYVVDINRAEGYPEE